MNTLPSHIILENERVLLRSLTESDIVHLLPFAENEPELWKYSLVSAAGEQNMRAYLNQALAEKERAYSHPFIVWDKEKQQYAGSTRFYDIQLPFASTQLGYTWYGKEFQGTGLNRHCKFLLLEYAFETLKFERVEFRADNQNDRSIAAMKAIGCTVEGVLRSHLPKVGGGRRDSIILSILADEWREKLKANFPFQKKNQVG